MPPRRKRPNPAEALYALEKAAGGGDPFAQRRREIIAKYARMSSNGRPATCDQPSRAERAGRIRPQDGADGKVIFPDRAAAEDAARELERLPDTRPMVAYECERSKRGHHHLKTAD